MFLGLGLLFLAASSMVLGRATPIARSLASESRIKTRAPITITPYTGSTASEHAPSSDSSSTSDPVLVLYANQTCTGDYITVGLGPSATSTCVSPNYNFLSAVVQYGSESTSSAHASVALPYTVDIVTDCNSGNSITKSYQCFSYNDPSDPYNSYATESS